MAHGGCFRGELPFCIINTIAQPMYVYVYIYVCTICVPCILIVMDGGITKFVRNFCRKTN